MFRNLITANVKIWTRHAGVLFVALFFFACRGVEPSNLQKLAPADALVYLESEDLARTLTAITQSKKFQQRSRSADDFSKLQNTQLAIAITGFEAREEAITEDTSDLNFVPRFVAIIDTHSLEAVNKTFVENGLKEFVEGNLGEGVQNSVAEENGTQIYSWTAKDARGFFAGLRDSMIFVGNDKTALLKSLELKSGNGESLEANEKLAAIRKLASEKKALASGYITPAGVQQIAGLLGVKVAAGASDDANIRTFISRSLPGVIQKSVSDVSWIATANEAGIEDELEISLEPNTARVFSETIAPGVASDVSIGKFIPKDAESFSIYNLKNTQLAFRSVVLTAAQNADILTGKMIAEFSRAALSSYGILDAEEFLSAIESNAATVRLDPEGDQSAIVARAKDSLDIAVLLSRSGFKKIDLQFENFSFWKNSDDVVAAVNEREIVVGESEVVKKCVGVYLNEAQRFATLDLAGAQKDSVTFSVSKNQTISTELFDLLGESDETSKPDESWVTSATRLDQKGIKRQTISDFGLIGEIAALLSDEK